MTQEILRLERLNKSFGGLRALVDVSLSIREGEVVALLGDNGAGKSTLVKIISGGLEATSGRMLFDGEERKFYSPAEAKAAGIETVYQDLSLCTNVDVVANFFMGREIVKRYFGIPVLQEKAMFEAVEKALGACRGVLEVISLGHRLDLVKQVGSPAQLEASYGISTWRGPLAIGHTRMSTESRIDLSHSQPFWAHGVADLATVHNGHVTNYHQLRRLYEQQGVTFYTDNDSEVIGVYLRDRLQRGRTLPEALADSITDLDGAYNYLVASSEGLGVVRDRFGDG